MHIKEYSMEETIKHLDENLVYLGHQVHSDYLEISVCSSLKSVSCPFCGHTSSRFHSTYPRSFQDLPLQGKKVIITLSNRKYFCSNPECTHNTFAEQFSFIQPKSKKTNRLLNLILTLSIEVSSVTASKMLRNGIVDIGKSTICNYLKKNSN